MPSENLVREVLAAVDRQGVVDLAAELVRIPSHPGIDRQEERVALALGRYFGERDFMVQMEEVEPGRPNLLVSVEGRAPGRHLLLCGHTDTVPVNADEAGFGLAGEVRDGWLVGRGSVDMKGALAAMSTAIAGLAGRLPAGRVTFAAVIDEEMESRGAEKLVETSFRADGAVVGEPTSNRLAIGHKGLEWLDVELVGRAAHGGTPEQGVNAIAAAGMFVALVENELQPRLHAKRHPILGPPTLNFGTIRGGDQPSTVAARCLIQLDRRTVPGETYHVITGELEELLSRVSHHFPGLRTVVRRAAGGMGGLVHVALVTPPESALVQSAQEAFRQVRGAPSELTTFPAWTDGALLAGFAGIPTVILGPGDLSLAHSPRESVAVDELVEAARLYAALALAFCAAGSE